MNQYEWKYGENNYQNYYDVKLGKDYLCVGLDAEYESYRALCGPGKEVL